MSEYAFRQMPVNAFLLSLRIVVEHSISGIKRCRIVNDVLRNTRSGIADLIIEIACGLHNLKVSFRQVKNEFNIQELLEPTYYQ